MGKRDFTLLHEGYDIDRRDYGGWTPISEAVSAGMRENVRALLKAGAKVDPVSKEALNDDENSTGGGITPLMEACDKGFIDIAKDLLRHGASVTKRNADGWTAVDFLRNCIVSISNEDDKNYVEDLTSLARTMEDMQRKQSFPVRGCAPQPNPRSKPFMKFPRNNLHEQAESDGLNSYKRAIGGLGAQSKSKKKTSHRTDERALFYEDDLMIRSPSPDDIILPSDCERSPVKRRDEQIDVSPMCTSPLPSSTSASPSLNLASRSCFDPLPIDDEFVIDDMAKRRKRKIRVSSETSPLSKTRGSKLSRIATQPACVSKTMNRSPSPKKALTSSQSGSSLLRDSSLNSTPSASTQAPMIIATLKFENEDGDRFRPDRMVTFPRSATMAEAEERFRSELDQSLQTRKFSMRLGDGREADAAIPLLSLGEPLVIISRLQKPTTEDLYKSRVGTTKEEVSRRLSGFDSTGNLDLSSSEIGDKYLTEQALKAAIDAKRMVTSLCLDGCDLTDAILSLLGVILSNVTKFSCKYSGLGDDHLCTLCSKSSLLNLSSLDISHNEVISGSSLNKFLERCNQISELYICDLDIGVGEDALVNAISGLQNLRILDISFNCWFKGKHIEKIVSSCDSLTSLILDGSDLTELPFEVSQYTPYRDLMLRHFVRSSILKSDACAGLPLNSIGKHPNNLQDFQ
ncbi:unnamed protein product [Strongylus vulgaris]|uniref:Uncharacterized protein n=1 Tax=Strongylus vulgaris TaxID=40348 RepID=A0A3P7JLP6_STRVU|nr:unnamed protein product [Strongylus vulgaris]